MTAPLLPIPKPPSFDELLSLKGRCAVVTGGAGAWVRRLCGGWRRRVPRSR